MVESNSSDQSTYCNSKACRLQDQSSAPSLLAMEMLLHWNWVVSKSFDQSRCSDSKVYRLLDQ